MEKYCPRCEKIVLKYPIELNAITRQDGKTWICRLCGVQESFIDYLLKKNYLEEITEEMKESEKRLADRLGLEPII
jgi:hypothetical protein